MALLLHPEEITHATFDQFDEELRLNRAEKPCQFCVLEVMLKDIIENPHRGIYTYVSDGGNVLAARRVEWAPGRFRVDFISNPER